MATKAFLIDPLRVGAVVALDAVPSDVQVLGLLGLDPSLSSLTAVELTNLGGAAAPNEVELATASTSHNAEVRHLGEFRFLKPDGSYRSVPGRGVVFDHSGLLGDDDVRSILASSGIWAAA